LSSHPMKFGGLLPYNGRLYSSVYDFFDVNNDVTLSHFVSNMNLSVTTDVQGGFQVRNANCDPTDPSTCLDAGFFGGYFGRVPSLWQPLLGGPVVNGQCCINIISRTSYGPSIFAIDPTQLGILDPLPATPLLYYPAAHPLLEEGQTGDGWSNTSILFNGATEVKGVVIPDGTRSVLFFGRQGVGRFCYGIGTDALALDGTLDKDGVELCYDPSDLAHGTHAYPYKYYVWAYDANELKAVKDGTKNPWDPKPYAVWDLTLPFATDNAHLNGATYDPNTGRIYVSQAVGDGTLPVIYSFKVQLP
jgi:hypothetical protein